jgi:hypothetical protein
LILQQFELALKPLLALESFLEVLTDVRIPLDGNFSPVTNQLKYPTQDDQASATYRDVFEYFHQTCGRTEERKNTGVVTWRIRDLLTQQVIAQKTVEIQGFQGAIRSNTRMTNQKRGNSIPGSGDL